MSVKSALPFLFIVVLASCQKEIDWGLNSTTTELLLVRTISKSGSDSTIVDYTYNAGKQLIEEKTSGVAGATNLDNDLKIYRTTGSIIDRTVQVAAGLVSAGIDSVVTKYTYNSTTQQYSSAVFKLTLMGITITDSTVFTYDAAGKVIYDELYQVVPPLPAILSAKNLYSYSSDASKLLSVIQYAATTPGGPLSPIATQTFTYDNKTAPLIMKKEAVVLLRPTLFSSQNATKITLTNTVDPSADFNLDLTYRYNSSSKPDSSFTTRTPGNTLTTTKFFYQ